MDGRTQQTVCRGALGWLEESRSSSMVLSEWVNMCELHAYVSLLWRWRQQPTGKQINIIHIPTYYTKQTTEKKCDCEIIIVKVSVCLIVCIHPGLCRLRWCRLPFEWVLMAIFISTYEFDTMLLFFNVFAAIASFHLLSMLPTLCGRYIIVSFLFFFSLHCHWFQFANMHCKNDKLQHKCIAQCSGLAVAIVFPLIY